jgi:hypothetical protein
MAHLGRDPSLSPLAENPSDLSLWGWHRCSLGLLMATAVQTFPLPNPGGTGWWEQQDLEVLQPWLWCWIINVHFSYPSVQQKYDKAISDNEITHVFCCSQQVFRGWILPHLHSTDWVTCLWVGVTPCIIDLCVVHRLAWPGDLSSSRSVTAHGLLGKEGPLQNQQLSFLRGSVGDVRRPCSLSTSWWIFIFPLLITACQSLDLPILNDI